MSDKWEKIVTRQDGKTDPASWRAPDEMQVVLVAQYIVEHFEPHLTEGAVSYATDWLIGQKRGDTANALWHATELRLEQAVEELLKGRNHE